MFLTQAGTQATLFQHAFAYSDGFARRDPAQGAGRARADRRWRPGRVAALGRLGVDDFQ